MIAPPTGNSIWLCTATHPHRSAFKGCPTGSQQVIYGNARHTQKIPSNRYVRCPTLMKWATACSPTFARGEGPLIAACSFIIRARARKCQDPTVSWHEVRGNLLFLLRIIIRARARKCQDPTVSWHEVRGNLLFLLRIIIIIFLLEYRVFEALRMHENS